MYQSLWRGLANHRPLGKVNHLRKGVYHYSKETREGIDVNESLDATSIDDMP